MIIEIKLRPNVIWFKVKWVDSIFLEWIESEEALNHSPSPKIKTKPKFNFFIIFEFIINSTLTMFGISRPISAIV
jgi:hypothetical protein